MLEPWVVDGVPFLRGDAAGQAVRLPSPPALIAADEAGLTLFRYDQPPPGDHPAGGAVLRLALDLGSPADFAERAEAGLPPEVREVVGPVLGPGVVRLHFGGREIARADVPAGYRPIVPIGAVLGPTEAMLLRECARQGAANPLSVTAEGGIPVAAPTVGTVRVDLHRAPAQDTVTAAEVADLLRNAVAADVDQPARRLAVAVAAARLFEPAPSGAPWALVPGWPAPGYRPAAPLRPRAGRPQGHRPFDVEFGPHTLLPWFAAAPVALTADAVRERELPGSRVRSVRVVPNTGGRPVTVELRAGDTTVGVELADQERTLRFLAAGAGDASYQWRVDGGEWRTGDHTILVVQLD